MQEIELKFLVPAAQLKGLMRQAKVKSSQEIQMAAHYYDTPKQELANAGIGLRIRQEGDAWVQTIKAGGDGIAARLEHNALLDNEQVQAMLATNTLLPDLSIYKNTSIAPALADFKLKKLAKKLTRQYVTDVQRTTRLLVEEDDAQGDSSIEMAYDHGQIIDGQDDSQRQDIQEIEFELISGELDFLFTTAKTWCKRYKLCLSTVTKAERGGLLITGQHHSPAVSADLSQLKVDKNSSMPAFVRAVVHNCLLQILPNSSAIVAGSEDNDHVLQLHIAIRRLLTALKAFGHFSDELNPDWQLVLTQTAALLDQYHELAYLSTHIEPKLQKHGAPLVNWAADMDAIKVSPINAVRANDFQLTLLELIAFTMSDPSIEPQADELAIDKLEAILSKSYKKLLKAEQRVDDGHDTDTDSDDDTTADTAHKVLRQLKTLRDLSEFAAPLYAKKKTKRWLKRLVKAQKAWGKYIDNKNGQQHYQQKSLIDPNAFYGAGWLAATLKNDIKRGKKKLERLQDSATFW